MGKKKQKAEPAKIGASVISAPALDTSNDPELAAAIAAIPKPDPRPRARKKGDPAAAGVTTLADLASAYLAHMEAEGRSEGTTASYRMELKTAMAELGEATPIVDLTPPKITAYFDSTRVTKLRNGKPKAKPSIEKTRRVLRLALVWGAERGIVDRVPLPVAIRA
jgi:hypothetical protein